MCWLTLGWQGQIEEGGLLLLFWSFWYQSSRRTLTSVLFSLLRKLWARLHHQVVLSRLWKRRESFLWRDVLPWPQGDHEIKKSWCCSGFFFFQTCFILCWLWREEKKGDSHGYITLKFNLAQRNRRQNNRCSLESHESFFCEWEKKLVSKHFSLLYASGK